MGIPNNKESPMTLAIKLRLGQQIAITPQFQQAMRLLQLSSVEFNQELEQAVAANPFLEEDSEAPEPANPGGSPRATQDPGTTRAEVPDPAPTPPPERSHSGSSDGEMSDWTDWTEAPVSLHDHLRTQLQQSSMSDRDRALAYMIVDGLSEAGYLETTLEELAELVATEDEVKLAELRAALSRVQQLDPPGIGGQSLQECLRLQLEARPADTEWREVALALVGQHFQLLAHREFTRLQQLLECDEAALHGARALIRTLDPRPGRTFAPDNTRYVIPDVIVTSQRDRWITALNPAVLPQLRINRAYADIAMGRNGCGPSFSRLLQEARWLLRSVEQRFNTIQRVADAIVARQQVFLRYGEAAMKPMALKDIATELGLHESTVCRATNGKYMATPRGLYEFKYFFSRHLATEDGGSCSATAIRALMKELIAAEAPQAPLSDAQLTRLLADQGLRMARRTVTKYRNLMRVPSVELRRVAGRAQHLALTTMGS